MVTLTGNITDVAGSLPESISRITVKAPSARIGGGSDIIVTSPARVTFDKTTGTLTLEGLHVGLSWLYIEGDGWSDSIPLAVAEGFQLILEAFANASGVPGMADYVLMIRNSGEHARLLAAAAVDGEIGDVIRLAQNAATTAERAAVVAENTVVAYTPRVDALEAMAGLSPESPVDGQTANLISQSGTLTNSAVGLSIRREVLAATTRVVHLYRADTPRPNTLYPVTWYGFVEPDNMANGDTLYKFFPKPPPFIQMISDFLDLEGWTPIGLHPEGWSTDGGAITYVTTSATTAGPKVLAYGGVPDAQNMDVEVVAKTSATAMNMRAQGGLIVHGSGGAVLNGYSMAWGQMNNGTLFLGAYDNGDWRELGQKRFPDNTWRTEPVWVRLRAEGSTISAKIWVDSQPEPEAWDLTATDTAHTGGYVGVRTSQHGGNITEKWHLVGIATDGETAPKETQ